MGSPADLRYRVKSVKPHPRQLATQKSGRDYATEPKGNLRIEETCFNPRLPSADRPPSSSFCSDVRQGKKETMHRTHPTMFNSKCHTLHTGGFHVSHIWPHTCKKKTCLWRCKSELQAAANTTLRKTEHTAWQLASIPKLESHMPLFFAGQFMGLWSLHFPFRDSDNVCQHASKLQFSIRIRVKRVKSTTRILLRHPAKMSLPYQCRA